jgi:hypothetical protein
LSSASFATRTNGACNVQRAIEAVAFERLLACGVDGVLRRPLLEGRAVWCDVLAPRFAPAFSVDVFAILLGLRATVTLQRKGAPPADT